MSFTLSHSYTDSSPIVTVGFDLETQVIWVIYHRLSGGATACPGLLSPSLFAKHKSGLWKLLAQPQANTASLLYTPRRLRTSLFLSLRTVCNDSSLLQEGFFFFFFFKPGISWTWKEQSSSSSSSSLVSLLRALWCIQTTSLSQAPGGGGQWGRQCQCVIPALFSLSTGSAPWGLTVKPTWQCTRGHASH